MANNHFETYVQNQAQNWQSVHARISRDAEERERQRRYAQTRAYRISLLNTARVASHAGDEPAKLWGEKAGKFCADFIRFAGSTVINGENFPRSTLLSEPDIIETETFATKRFMRKEQIHTQSRLREKGWSIRGYGIAYANPEPMAGTENVRASFSQRFGDKPSADVFLCEDGLVRAGVSPLEVSNTDGSVRVPQFATWNVTSSYRHSSHVSYGGSTYIGNSEPITIDESRVTNTRTFTLLDPVVGLQHALERIASEITQIPRTYS